MKEHMPNMEPEEAELEGRMLQATMRESLGDKEPTAEDYDEALRVVEEIKELAARESATEKALNILGRASETARYVVFRAVATPDIFVNEVLAEQHDRFMAKFDDAANKLRKLKEQAEESKA